MAYRLELNSFSLILSAASKELNQSIKLLAMKINVNLVLSAKIFCVPHFGNLSKKMGIFLRAF